MDAFAIATIRSGSVTDQRWSGHTAQIVTSGGQPVRGFGAHAISSFQSLEDASDSDVQTAPLNSGDVEMVLDRERELVDWLRGFRTRGIDCCFRLLRCLLVGRGWLRWRSGHDDQSGVQSIFFETLSRYQVGVGQAHRRFALLSFALDRRPHFSIWRYTSLAGLADTNLRC